MFALWIPLAHAAPGFYHPDDIAGLSARFAEASKAGVPFEERSRKAEGVAAGLADYRLALDLLGARAPEAERARLAELDKRYAREVAVLDKFAGAMMDDFDAEFTAAMDRAIKAFPGAKECVAEVPIGRPLPGIPARTQKNPDCVGEDLNAKVAAAIDADKALATAVAEILRLKWPEVTIDAAPQAPIGGAARWADPVALLRTGADRALDAIDRADAEKRDAFAAALEDGATIEQKKALVEQAKAVTAETAARRAALAGPVLAAADAEAAKWAKKGEPATGWCANPAMFGGCTGEDATKALVPRWIAAPKVSKALAR